MTLKNKYRIAYFDEDEQICIIDIWAISSQDAIAHLGNIQIIWARLQVP